MLNYKGYLISVIIGIILGSWVMKIYKDNQILSDKNQTLVTQEVTRVWLKHISQEEVSTNQENKKQIVFREREVLKHVKEYVDTDSMPAEYASMYNKSLMLSADGD